MGLWKYALSSAETAPNAAPILLRGDICDNIKTAAELGYQGLEVHMREDTILDYQAVAKICGDLGVTVAAVATGRLNTQGKVDLIDDRPYITDAAMKGMGEYIKMAAALGSNLIIGWVKGNIPDGAGPEPYLARLAHNLKLLCRHAADEGVRVFFEVINRYEANIFTATRETVEFLNQWEIPNCYVHLDTFHMNIGETDPVGAIRSCGGRLGYFHVADNTRMYPGSGTLDFKSYFSALKDIAYQGFVSVECLPGSDGKTAAQKALVYLKSCE